VELTNGRIPSIIDDNRIGQVTLKPGYIYEFLPLRESMHVVLYVPGCIIKHQMTPMRFVIAARLVLSYRAESLITTIR
jgi:hypothetical protein